MAERKARRKTKDEQAAEAAERELARLLQWAESHGAPVRLLVGWNPDTGKWAPTSPVGMLLGLIQENNFPTTAAKITGIRNLSALLAKGTEYLEDEVEDRMYVEIGARPFVDLVREVELAEGVAESTLVRVANREAKHDGKFALTMLGRRYAQRWREQQAIFTGEGPDERDKAISDALQDPNLASRLAELAHHIEDTVPRDT